MSAMGQKQTLTSVKPMSALPPKAEIVEGDHHVRFVPEAEVKVCSVIGGLTPQSNR
jgi:hypothetical protein